MPPPSRRSKFSRLRRFGMVKAMLQSGLRRIMGCSLWSFWTVGYWGMAWLMVLRRLTSKTETLCFVGSWPFCAVLLFPTGTFDAFLLLCSHISLAVCVVLEVASLFCHEKCGEFVGWMPDAPLLGAVGSVSMYNQFHGGIPFRFYFWDTVAGAVVTAGYILGYGVVYWYIERRMIHTAETRRGQGS